MSKHSQDAVNNFLCGYNCAQSVFLAFAERYGIDKDTALKISSSFGGGMGRLREVCGAVSAMFAITGLEKGYTEPDNDTEKSKHYELIQFLANKFKEQHSTIICRELLNLQDKEETHVPAKRTEEYYKTRPCAKFICTAAELIEKFVLE